MSVETFNGTNVNPILDGIKKINIDKLDIYACMEGSYGIYDYKFTPVFETIEQWNEFCKLSYLDRKELLKSAQEVNNCYSVYEFINEHRDYGFGYQVHFSTTNKNLLTIENLKRVIGRHSILESGNIEIKNSKTNKTIEFKLDKLNREIKIDDTKAIKKDIELIK